MKEINITMDGHAVTLEPCWKSYEELVWMHYDLFPKPPLIDPIALGINFIITYEGGPEKAPTGTVRPDRKLRLRDGMAIKVKIDPEEFKTQPV